MLSQDQQTYFKMLASNFDKNIEIRMIKAGEKPKRIFLKYDDLLNFEAPQDTNVYVGMFERKNKRGTAKDVTKTNVLYLDFDDMSLDGIYYIIEAHKLPKPTMIVNSGHGYHVYWQLAKPIGVEVLPVLKALQKLTGADPSGVDVARILRVPDTMNVKGEAVKCHVVDFNDHTTPIERFEDILGVKAKLDEPKNTGAIYELLEVKFNGLNNMAHGVEKGERNFATARIVQTLRRLNYTKQEVIDIVLRWNNLNRPKKSVRELKQDINVFWYDYTDKDRYRYDGKTFTDMRLQELNERFIDNETTFFIGSELDTHNYDNELLKPAIFKETTGLTFAVLSIIKLAEDRGITREHIADLTKRHYNDSNLRNSLNILQDKKYIKVKKDGHKRLYIFTEKANYKRGYTAVSKSLHRSFIHDELKEHEYKMMILLEWYCFDSKTELYPSNDTLAYRLNRTDRNVKKILKDLEYKQFIVTEYKHGKRYIRLIYR